MNSCPIAPAAAKPRISYTTAGCFCINSNAGSNWIGISTYAPRGDWAIYGARSRKAAMSSVCMTLSAHIICCPENGLNFALISSCVELVKPSRSRLIPSSVRPYAELPLWLPFFLPPLGWCRVKMATPTVTSATTAYL